MKCALFEIPGIANLQTDAEIDMPTLKPDEVIVRVKMVGINPIDYFVVTGRHGLGSGAPELKAHPMPHVPGTELSGTVQKVGERVKDLKEGERVLAYSRLFDGTCDDCMAGNQLQCRNGGMLGLSTNGAFAEYVSLPFQNVVKIPDWMSWELASSLPVAALTPFHALREADLSMNDWLTVIGASGNTGQFAVQFGKMMGAKVIAVSRKKWVKDFLGADYNVQSYDNIVDEVKYITEGRMSDLVLNSIGMSMWQQAYNALARNGAVIVFGTLTGRRAEIDLQDIYSRQRKIIGSTGGNRSELVEIVNSNAKDLKIKIWRKFRLAEADKALDSLFSKERDGRILLSVEG